MSVLVAKLELKSLTDFQKEIHTTEDSSEKISSLFYRMFVKSTWHSNILAPLKSSKDGDDVLYEVNPIFHFLFTTYFKYKLPCIRVKPQYKDKVRIRWSHNPGTAPIITGVFSENDDPFHSIDHVWCDIFFQFFQKPGSGKRRLHNQGIGNVGCLENWNTFLPEYPINVEQPWFYSMDHALAFPILYKNSQTKAVHRYRFRKSYFDFLCMEMLNEDKEWIPVNQSQKKYVDVYGSSKFKIPELWGKYAYISPSEIEFYRKCKERQPMYIRDIVVCDIKNKDSYGAVSEIALQSKNPCLAMFWVSENQNAIKNHYFSNYTTNEKDVYEGWDPIYKTSLMYGTNAKFSDMDSDHFSIA
jgi:hypothetical protein